MQKLTKTQVLALFLGAATAQDSFISILNALGDADQVPDKQTLRTQSSGAVCTGNADCSAENELCASFRAAGVAEVENFCVQAGDQNVGNACGALGRRNGVAFMVQCWETPAQGEIAVAPAEVDVAALLTGLEGLVNKVDVNWDGLDDLVVSPRFNWQDGWYTKIADGDDAGKWLETDKEADNRCHIDSQCPKRDADGVKMETDDPAWDSTPAQCCAQYPDMNNRRCILEAEHNIQITVGPLTFAPTCTSLLVPEGGNDDVVPENAQDDIADGALAEAAEELNSFYTNQLSDAKDNAGYADMTEEEKAEFDQAAEAAKAERDEFFAELKVTAGYDGDDCDKECKARFESELLKWGKEVYQTCKDEPKGIACRQANEIRKDDEAARAKGDKNYYHGMTDDERATFDKESLDRKDALESTLAAAWLKDHAPKAGEEGSDCSVTKCTNPNHCCGDSTPQEGAFVNKKLEKICGNKIMKKYEDALGSKYDHVCQGAQKVMATAAAALVAAYSLM